MSDNDTIEGRFELHYDPATYRRVIAGKDVIIHCHHYNSRVQKTIEGASVVDGKMIIRSSAETVFAEQIEAALRAGDDDATKRAVAARLYAHLGYGVLDLSQASEGRVTASESHYVEGWLAGFGKHDQPVCTFTEGYIQGALYATSGQRVYARERECMARGDAQCVFEINHERTAEPALAPLVKGTVDFQPKTTGKYLGSPNVDEQKIIDALVSMPFYGNAEGLIPAFSVYLANTPADYYNLISIRFVEEMMAKRRGKTAKRMLTTDGETCAMNTFRGIMNSAEWEGLVAPMIQEQRDNMFALLAISNGLGWGNWHILSHADASQITFESLNGYEALGYREYRGDSAHPQCFMLTGVAAGLLELVYGSGTIAERLGTCATHEEACISRGRSACSFVVERQQ